MQAVLDFIKMIIAGWELYVPAISALLTALITLCLLIPGPQPERFLQWLVDFITKFSNKPKP